MERIPKIVLISVLLVVLIASCSSPSNQVERVFSSHSKQFESVFDSTPNLDISFSPDSSKIICESMLVNDENAGKVGHFIFYQPLSQNEISQILAYQGLNIDLDPTALTLFLDSLSYDKEFAISHNTVEYTMRKRTECGVCVLSIGKVNDSSHMTMLQKNTLIPRIMRFDALISKADSATADIEIETENGLISAMTTTDSLISFQYQSLSDFKIIFRNLNTGYVKKIGVLPAGCLSLPDGGYLFEFNLDLTPKKKTTVYSGEYYFSRPDQSFMVRNY